MDENILREYLSNTLNSYDDYDWGEFDEIIDIQFAIDTIFENEDYEELYANYFATYQLNGNMDLLQGASRQGWEEHRYGNSILQPYRPQW